MKDYIAAAVLGLAPVVLIFVPWFEARGDVSPWEWFFIGCIPRPTPREGSVYREILKEAYAIQADLIILASAKGDFPDYPFGPNAARVVRHANCSVLVHRG